MADVLSLGFPYPFSDDKKGLAEYEFVKLIKESNNEYIEFVYPEKGTMSKKFIESTLKRYCVPDSYSFKKSVIKGTSDFMYQFKIKKNMEPKYISPLNYIGGKFNTLDFLNEHIPNNIDTFYDLFGGGANVCINSNAKRVVYNDVNCYVVDLLNYLSSTHPYTIYQDIQVYQEKYHLDKGNKEGYTMLRNEYNKTKSSLLLYLLICYGFEHQIRFNSKHEFNNPCGNSGFNDEMYEKLISYYLRCQDIDIEFRCNSFVDYVTEVKENDFVYLDPPYLGNRGAYQDGKRGFNGWNEEQEQELHTFMENLDSNNIRFMLSNCVEHTSGNENPLEKWSDDNGFSFYTDTKVIKRNRTARKEIVITNEKV